MKKKRLLIVLFCSMLVVFGGGYFALHLAFGFKNSVTPAEDIGKIKYVDTNGNDIFAGSSSAVVFESPVNALEIEIEGDVAHITAFDFSVVHAPARGVVKSAANGVVVIDHGNSTTSTISGLLQVGVREGDYVYCGHPIGTTLSQVNFSVSVSSLPLDMQWLLSSAV